MNRLLKSAVLSLAIGATVLSSVVPASAGGWDRPRHHHNGGEAAALGIIGLAAGVIVGRVESVRLDNKTYEAVVSLKIDNGYQFSKDTIAAILTSGLLGDQYIGIEAGASDANLKAGDRITATQSAVVLENLIGQFLYGRAEQGSSSDTDAAGSAGAAATAGGKP